MFEELKTRLLSWTPELANNFHDNVTRQGNYAWRVWEQTPNGYYFYDAGCAEYRDLNGDTWILKIGDFVENYQAHQSLAQYHEDNDLIRLDKPTLIERHFIYDIIFTLVKLESPYSTRGINTDQLIKVENRLDTLVDIAKLYLRSGNTMAESLDKLRDVPANIYPVEFLGDNFRYDPVSQKFFLYGLRFEAMKQHFLDYLDMTLDLTNKGLEMLGYSYDLSSELKEIRNNECTTLQPL